MKIKQNIGMLDRVFRIGICGAMIYLGFFEHSIVTDEVARIILGVFGCIMLLTALVGNCPLYEVIGLNTCKRCSNNTDNTHT